MAAATTLLTTTLKASVNDSTHTLTLADTTNVSVGQRLYLDRELVAVARVGPITGQVFTRRGVDGTVAQPHAAGATVTIGGAHQFYVTDPAGVPANEELVSPWINVLSGAKWIVAGDSFAATGRYWAQQITTSTTGALGVVTTTTTTVP